MNYTSFTGNIVADPESRSITGGKTVAEFRVGISGYNDKTTFVKVVAWEKLAEIIIKNKKKGDKVLVEGRLELDEWTDKTSGQKRSQLYVVAEKVEFLSSGAPKEGSPKSNGKPAPNAPKDDSGVQDEADIPF